MTIFVLITQHKYRICLKANNVLLLIITCVPVNKVKQSLYRPGQAQRVPRS